MIDMTGIFDEFDFMEFPEIYEMDGTYEERVVDNFEGNNLIIDTAMVTDGDKLYETGINDSEYYRDWIIVEAYNTKEEAQIGHNKWVGIMTSVEKPAKLTDCQNAGITKKIEKTRDLIYIRKLKIKE